MTSIGSTTQAHSRPSATEVLRRFTEMVLAELGNTYRRSTEPETPPPLLSYSDEALNLDKLRRQPFGVVFVEGQKAAFTVPHGRRLVIEYLDIACWGRSPRPLVQLTTRSEDMFRNVTVRCSDSEGYGVSPTWPVQIKESTSNMFVFSSGSMRQSPIVPVDTYVQMWGYLEQVGSSCTH